MSGLPITIVTAFFDIGRGEWEHYNRTESEYLGHFKNMLQIKMDMVIFTEFKYVEFITRYRDHLKYKTQIVVLSLKDTYMYKEFYSDVMSVYKSPFHALNHPNPKAPEVSKPLYNIITCNKMDFMRRAINYTEHNYLVWIDAGYTHSTIDLSKIDWNPSSLLDHNDRMCIIALKDVKCINPNPEIFFNMYDDVVIGGFFGGYKHTVKVIADKYYKLLTDLLWNKHIIDDDQFYNSLLVTYHPELFTVYYTSWYGGMFIQ